MPVKALCDSAASTDSKESNRLVFLETELQRLDALDSLQSQSDPPEDNVEWDSALEGLSSCSFACARKDVTIWKHRSPWTRF